MSTLAPSRPEGRARRTEYEGATLPPRISEVASVIGIRTSSLTVSLWIKVLVCSSVLFIIWPPSGSGSVVSVDYTSLAFKYGFGGLQAILAACMICENKTLAPRPFFVLAALALSLIGLLSFAYVQLFRPGETSYGAALFPLLVCAMPAFIPPRAVQVELGRLTSALLLLLVLGSVAQIAWQLADAQGTLTDEISHERTYVLVFFLLLVGFERRLWASAFAIFLIAVSLYLRPSSTLAVTTGIALIAISLRLANLRRVLRLFPYVVVFFLLTQNLIFATDPQVVEAVLNFETEFKQGKLDSYSRTESLSNSDFRLAVFRAANDEINMYSPWVGKAFTGDVNVYVGKYIHWPGFIGFSEVHSDFLSLLLQGGILGYSLFAMIFVGIVRIASRSADLAEALGAKRGEALLRSIPLMTCLFGIYISFNPLMPKVEYVLFFLILGPISVLCARELVFQSVEGPTLRVTAGLSSAGSRYR